MFLSNFITNCLISVTMNCGGTSAENCTYFDSATTVVSGACKANICKVNTNICQIRLDFRWEMSNFCQPGNCFFVQNKQNKVLTYVLPDAADGSKKFYCCVQNILNVIIVKTTEYIQNCILNVSKIFFFLIFLALSLFLDHQPALCLLDWWLLEILIQGEKKWQTEHNVWLIHSQLQIRLLYLWFVESTLVTMVNFDFWHEFKQNSYRNKTF